MKQTYLFFLVLILFFGFSCKKEEKHAPAPVCVIANLQDGQEFFDDEDILVMVSVDDNNSVITSVMLYVDDKSYTGTSEFPYNFTIKAGDLTVNAHTIKAVARNSNGKQGEASVNIIVEKDTTLYESPDFVSFSDGKLPKGWEAEGWHIFSFDGFDDSFSLCSIEKNSKVKTIKTCDYVEFFLSGYGGGVELYMDGVLKRTYYDKNRPFWVKHTFYCPSYGLHTFEWVAIIFTSHQQTSSIGLDAIKFETKTKK